MASFSPWRLSGAQDALAPEFVGIVLGFHCVPNRPLIGAEIEYQMHLPCYLFWLNTKLRDHYPFDVFPVGCTLKLTERLPTLVLHPRLDVRADLSHSFEFCSIVVRISIPNSFSIAIISSTVSSDIGLLTRFSETRSVPSEGAAVPDPCLAGDICLLLRSPNAQVQRAEAICDVPAVAGAGTCSIVRALEVVQVSECMRQVYIGGG